MSLLPSNPSPLRAWMVLGVFSVALGMLAARAVYLQVLNSGYLQSQGNARHLRTIRIHDHPRDLRLPRARARRGHDRQYAPEHALPHGGPHWCTR